MSSVKRKRVSEYKIKKIVLGDLKIDCLHYRQEKLKNALFVACKSACKFKEF